MSASTNPESCEDIALRLVDVAHPLAKSYFRTSLTVERKADSSPVTEAGHCTEHAGRVGRDLPGSWHLGRRIWSQRRGCALSLGARPD